MARYFSWPPVSHSSNLKALPLASSLMYRKPSPMVACVFSSKSPPENMFRTEDLPTPDSPMMQILNSAS